MRTQITGPLADTIQGAIAEEVLRACVHCGMCNATCPTYQLTGDELDGPRGRIYLIKQALEGEPAGEITRTHLDHCLSCRACETTCPSGVEYHRLLDIGRQEVERTAPPRPLAERAFRWLLRAVVPYPKRLRPLMALGRMVRLTLPDTLASKLEPPPPARPVPAVESGRAMVQLAGCVQSVAAPHYNAATARVLGAIGVGVRENPAAGCCGALSFHLDAPDEARALARRNIEAWTADLDAGAEAVLVNASGCAAFIRDYPDLFAGDAEWQAKARRVADAVRDPIQVLETADLSTVRAPASDPIAVHDPCTLQHGLKLPGRITALLTRLGYTVAPVADAHLCCGSAGAYSLLQPKFANELKANKLKALTAASPTAIYTANIGCAMHLADGSPVPVRHWIEAVEAVLIKEN